MRRKPAGLGMALLLALCLLLSGCGGGGRDEAAIPTRRSSGQGAEEETDEGEQAPAALTSFALAYHAGQSLDPITCGDGAQLQLATLLYEPLFQLDGEFSPQPLLCTGYTVSEDGLVYTLSIRQGVTFSDGSQLEARDVASSLRRAAASQRYGSRLRDIRQVTTRGSDTVVVTLARPNSHLPALLDIPVVKTGTEEDAAPAGTGPYLFITSGEGAFLAANPNWWQGRTLPLERIELVDAKDSDTVLYLFTAREIQVYAADLTRGEAALSGRLDAVDIPTATMQFLGINTRRAALQDQELRRVLRLGIPRETVVEGYLSGHAAPAQFAISPASGDYPAEMETAYSLETYRQSLTALWAAEEEREPLTLTLLVNADSASKTAIAQYLAQSLSVEGLLQVTVEALAWTDYLEALAGGDFDLYYGEVRLTADWDISELIGTGGELNYGGWSAVDTDAMLEACRAGGENAYRNLCRHLREAVPLLPVCFKSASLLTHSGAVENARPTAANIFYNFPDWVLHFAQPAEESAP